MLRTALQAALSAGVAFAAEYWRLAPATMHQMIYLLLPLVLTEVASASWMRRLVASRKEHPLADDPELTIYPQDTWSRGLVRLNLAMLGIVLGFTFDLLSGTRHYAVMTVIGWCLYGNCRSIMRHLEIIARYHHFKLPILPDERMGELRERLGQGDKHV